MTQPIQEPSNDRSLAAVDYRTRQLARRPVPGESPEIPWIRLYSETPQAFAADDRQGIIYPDQVINNYPDVFDYDTTGGEPWAVLLLVTGLYQATIRIDVADSVSAPHPASGASLELLGTDYLDATSGYHSVWIPGFTTANIPPDPDPGIPFTSGFTHKIDHMFLGGPTFFFGGQWEIEGYITTLDALELNAASLEVRRLGAVLGFPYDTPS